MRAYEQINQKLEILYTFLVDNFDALESDLIDLISNPEKIGNISKFASLLSDFKKPVFISPLLERISLANKTDVWLSDFLYLAANLLDDCADEFKIPQTLITKLESWVLEDKGELAWKAAGLLKFVCSERSEKIQLQKLKNNNDFFLTYVECIIGLLWYDRQKHIGLVKQLANDVSIDEHLREYCRSLIEKQ